MAREFGTASTDRIATALLSNATQRSYSLWARRTGDGGGSQGALWHKGSSAGGGGAVTGAHLTSGNQVFVSNSVDTASITPSANKLVLALVGQHFGVSGTPGVPSLTGNGLTWVLVAQIEDSTAFYRLCVFRAMGSAPTTGPVNIANPTIFDYAMWSIVEFGGVDTSGTNGSGAIVQSATNINETFNTGMTVTLGAFSSASNATYGGLWTYTSTSGGITPGSGFTELGESIRVRDTIETEWKSTNDTTVDGTWASSQSEGIAIEIKAGASSPSGMDSLFNDSAGTYKFSRGWSTTAGIWSIVRPSADVWHNIVVTYDGGSASNNPIVYVDGSSVTVTTVTAPAGALDTSNADAYWLGNREADSARNWAGYLAEFGVWDRILTAGEVVGLGKGFSPLFYRRNLISYVDLIRTLRDAVRAAPTAVGTTVFAHPRIIYPE